MEALYKLQNNTKLLIDKAQINFKKAPKERITPVYVETRLEALESLWNEFSLTHKSIVKGVTDAQRDSDKYFVNDIYDVTEEAYILHKTQLKEILNSQRNRSSDQRPITNVDHMTSNNVRLPKINIPKFSGTYSEWTTFKDLFTSLIHNNNNLEDVQKLHYLKGLLSGEAEQLVRHMQVTSDNYTECWSLLNSRYNNKRFLSNCLLKRLLSQANVNESSNSLKGLLDTTMECLNGLKNLGVDVSTWDLIIIFIISSKLDPESRKQWETKISVKDELPLLSEFKEFLEARFRALEFLDTKSSRPKVHHVVNSDNKANSTTCPFCKEVHKLYNCKKFAQESYKSRHSFVQTNRLCYNCLNANHAIKFCRQKTTCHICNRRHHSLLHPNTVSNSTVSEGSNTEAEVKSAVSNVQASLSVGEPSNSNLVSHFSKGSVPKQVLLATALVEAQTRSGSTQLLRVLLDQGSQASFIAESAVQMLGLKKNPTKSVISGIGGERSSFASKYTVKLTIHSRSDPSFRVQVHAFVLGTITSLLPSEKLEQTYWPELKGITLADPQFHTPSKIDLLLGAEIYGQVIREGLIQGPPNLPVAQNTALGWILSGQISSNSDSLHCHHVIQSSSDQADDNAFLRKFWELESEPSDRKVILTEEEQKCEEFYSKTTKRDATGRYVVKLPFKTDSPSCTLGGSEGIAHKRFINLEKRLLNNPSFSTQYSAVIKEYIELGHAEVVPQIELGKDACYLPHHAVVREDKSTTKVRVVFDASCVGHNGVALNTELMVGPTLQPELRQTIMRWRCHPISIVADIEKMYRQVKVAEEDADYQRILWRDNPNAELKHIRLLRVTFGTSPAPYLAVRSLQQLARDEGNDFPLAADRVLTSFYVDDLLTGCQSVAEGEVIYQQLNQLLARGGFKLQKWSSSSDDLLEKIKEDAAEQDNLEIKMDATTKILGLTYLRKLDEFRYIVQLPPPETPITKRKAISDIARLFDPLGWLAPVIITAKVFIQRLWLEGCEWDVELPDHLLKEWLIYRTNLHHLKDFRLPRWIQTSQLDVSLELHGFSDASNIAFAAAVYVRCIDADGRVHVRLVAAKTKVAPVKQVSIPRLELCGASLLAKLLDEVSDTLGICKENIHAWTDSTVVLAWLSSHPSRWKTFVGNRVSTILSHVENSHWAHVQSSHNPADLASRGVTPQELASSSLWTQGPSWLHNETIEYTRPKSISTNLEEKSIKVHVLTEPLEENPLWTKYSSLQRLIRVTAYCRRVLKWTKQSHGEKRFESCLTNEEIQEATKTCIKHFQNHEFSEEIKDIRKTGSVKSTSKLKNLCPVLDNDGILRVSGRLDNAELDDAVKHPIILPHNSHFTDLVIDDAHKKTLHGGPTLMLGQLRTRYWIIAAKTKVKAHVRKCVKCMKYSTSPQAPLMGQLPSSRVTPARPFLKSGVDFAGPISIRTSKGRGQKSYKGYICVFICMVTKAIHFLNSRPLSMLPDNPKDPNPLTPGHFLIGEPLIAVPERNYENSNIRSLRRWQLTQRMLQDFWRRWSDEYLVNLLQRYKWTKNVPEPNIGDVVLVKEDNLPPARWLMGKVVEKHPGLDKVTRVVTLKCNGSLIKRPTSKLCILPISK